MKPRIHSSLLLFATLIIGIILGALIQSNIRDRHNKHISIMSSEENFVAAFENAIAPHDEEQASQVHEILTKSAPRVLACIKEGRQLVRTELEDMRNQLLPILDPDQQERLKERMQPPKHHSPDKK